MNPIIQDIPLRIIKEQELVIGPLAWEEAKKVIGLQINYEAKIVTISGDSNKTIDALVARYERLFGLASKEVCRDSVKDLLKKLPANDIPNSLK